MKGKQEARLPPPPARPINSWVREAIAFAGISQAELARLLSERLRTAYDRSMVNKMTIGRDLSADEVFAIADLTGHRAPGRSADLPATRVVRVMGAVQAGVFAESWELPEEDQHPVLIPDDATFRGMRLHAAVTRGPSMDRLYPEGTVIVFTDYVDRGEQPIFGKRYIVERERADGFREHTVKTLWRDAAGKAWLIPESTDPLYQQPIPLDGDEGDTVRILGRVVYSVRRE